MNARSASGRRGQPIFALAAIMVIWMAARAATWNPKYEAKAASAARVMTGKKAAPQLVRAPRLPKDVAVYAGNGKTRPPELLAMRVDQQVRLLPSGTIIKPPATDGTATSFRLASDYRLAPSPFARLPVKRESSLPGEAPRQGDRRWTFDAWLLMRAGSGDAAQALGAASYGASQAGAVARFRLGNGDLHESYGYLRTSLAINAPGKDKELALGFGVRPAQRVPLRVLAEARLFDSGGAPMRVRPVVTVVTELPWQNLPAGLRAEAYGQVGYAGGRDPTPFFDAQGVVDRSVSKAIGVKRDVRIGAGVWAGGQEGAVRLDVGPRLSLPIDVGAGLSSRVALDWRLRVAGNARPPSGPALTIASSF